MIKRFLGIVFLILISAKCALSQSDTLMPQLKKYDKYMDFVVKNLQYPHHAAENGISGIVEYAFVINTKGCIQNIEIFSSPDKSLSEEVIRIAKKTKCKWIPGKIDGILTDIEMESRTVFVLQ